MFILKKYSGSNVEMNITIGDAYTFIGKEENPKEFKEIKDRYNHGDEIYAFICNGTSELPLSTKQTSMIMTENGSTYKFIRKANGKN